MLHTSWCNFGTTCTCVSPLLRHCEPDWKRFNMEKARARKLLNPTCQSQTIIWRSSDPDAILVPDWLKFNELTHPSCPSKMANLSNLLTNSNEDICLWMKLGLLCLLKYCWSETCYYVC